MHSVLPQLILNSETPPLKLYEFYKFSSSSFYLRYELQRSYIRRLRPLNLIFSMQYNRRFAYSPFSLPLRVTFSLLPLTLMCHVSPATPYFMQIPVIFSLFSLMCRNVIITLAWSLTGVHRDEWKHSQESAEWAEPSNPGREKSRNLMKDGGWLCGAPLSDRWGDFNESWLQGLRSSPHLPSWVGPPEAYGPWYNILYYLASGVLHGGVSSSCKGLQPRLFFTLFIYLFILAPSWSSWQLLKEAVRDRVTHHTKNQRWAKRVIVQNSPLRSSWMKVTASKPFVWRGWAYFWRGTLSPWQLAQDDDIWKRRWNIEQGIRQIQLSR